MYVVNITDDNDSFINCADNKSDDINIIVKDLLLSVPGSELLLSLLGLITYTSIKLLVNGQVFLPISSC